MASPNHNMRVQNLSVPYMPKLQYRIRSSEGASLPRTDSISPVSPVSTSFSLPTVSTAPTSPKSSDHGSSPSIKEATLEGVSSKDARSSSITPLHLSPTLPGKKTKKRGGSFFAFLNVKEPSQQAFDDYQRQMRKKGASKNGRVSAIGLPGVSSAKLPPTVPKVNSRWDGIPQAVKEKENKEQGDSSQSIAGRSRLIRTSGSEGSTSTTTSSIRSRGSSLNSKSRGLQHLRAADITDPYGWETASGSSGSISRNDIKAHDEALKALSITSSPKPYFTVSQAPPLPSSLPENRPQKASADAGLLLDPSSCSSSPTGSNIRSLPTTSIALPLPKESSYLQSDHCTKSGLRTTAIEIPDANEIIITSKGHHVLGPPASAGRKTRHSPFLAGEAEEMTVPDKDASPNNASTIQPMSHGSSPFDPLCASPNDVNPDRWAARGANKDTSNMDGTAFSCSGADTNSISHAIAPWEYPSPKINDGSKERDHSLPTPDGGQKLRKKSMMGLFNK